MNRLDELGVTLFCVGTVSLWGGCTGSGSTEPTQPAGQNVSRVESAFLDTSRIASDHVVTGNALTNTTPSVAGSADQSVPASRVDALGKLKLNLEQANAIRKESGTGPSTFTSHFDKTGATDGVWAFGIGGLGASVKVRSGKGATAGDFDSILRVFLAQNQSLFAASDGLVGPTLSEYSLPGDKVMHYVEYHQIVDGVPVLDGEVSASFIDGVLVSINGAIEDPQLVRAAKAKLSPERTSAAEAEAKLEDVDVLLEAPRLMWDHDGQQLIHHLRIAKKDGSDARTRLVSAATGALVRELDGRKNASWTEASRTYRVFSPQSGDTHPYAMNDTNESWISVAYVNPPNQTLYQHGDFGNNSYAAHTYGYVYTGPANPSRVDDPAYRTQPWYSGDFTSPYDPNGGRSQDFSSQHDTFWAENAAQVTASTAFRNYISDWAPVAIITGVPNGATTYINGDGGWGINDVHSVIQMDGGTQSEWGTYPNVASLGTIFHEYGHIVDYRIKGDRGSNCNETASLAEEIAAMFAMSVFMYDWGITSGFTGYYGHTEPGWGWDPTTLGSLQGLGQPNADLALVHLDNNAQLSCYDTRTSPACGIAMYNWGVSLLQAYWEAAHAVNCGGGICGYLNDGSSYIDARNALAYAIKNTGLSQGYIPFVANFLCYYYYVIGSPVWDNRWWIFNHHRLIGPNYGYSPCHAW